MAIAAWQVGDSGKASWLWLLAYFVVITLGELYLSPTGLSLVTKIAPAAMVSLMMGIWLATDFIGNFLAGWLGSYWSAVPKAEFFVMIAAIGVVAGILVYLIGRSPAALSDPPAA
jgi:POT family proton-dependent oligopeptide transporter